MSVKDGGPAFPHTYDMVSVDNNRGGMTLRDYFAAKAMQTFLHPNWMELTAREANSDPEIARAVVASKAYRYADAMLKERTK